MSLDKALRVFCRVTSCGKNITAPGLLFVGMKQSFTFPPHGPLSKTVFSVARACILPAPSSSENTAAPGSLFVGLKRSFTFSLYEPGIHSCKAEGVLYELLTRDRR